MKSTRACAAVGALLLAGCGTIVGLSDPHEVMVHTNPPGAELFVNGLPTGVRSPGVVLLDPADEHRVDARLDDLHGGTHVKRTASVGVTVCDIIFTLGLGISIDWSTGALYYFPENVVVNLGRTYGPEPAIAEQYPPVPALIPHSDPVSPNQPVVKAGRVTYGGETQTTNLMQPPPSSPCEICGEQVAPGATCRACGQPR